MEKLGPGLAGRYSIFSTQSEQLRVKKMVIVKRKSESILSFGMNKVYKKDLLNCYQASLNCGKVSKYGVSY